MKFLKVGKKSGEKVRKELMASGILSPEYGIIREKGFLLFPVLGPYKDYEIQELPAEKREIKSPKLKDALSGILEDDEIDSLTAAFDTIGDIAILEVPKNLSKKKKEIAEALLQVNKNLKAVFGKTGPMEGTFRTRRITHLAGENRTETVYTEHKTKMKLDVSKVYFSVRLSNERKRIAGLVKEGERVLVLFAGVGPFALVIAKSHPGAEVTALELNPDAVGYMHENVALNKLRNVEIIEGDAAQFSGTGFDRIVMPLPKSAEDFLEVAVNAVRDGGIIHFYTFVPSENAIEHAFRKAKGSVKGARFERVYASVVRPYSKDTVQVVLDLKARKT